MYQICIKQLWTCQVYEYLCDMSSVPACRSWKIPEAIGGIAFHSCNRWKDVEMMEITMNIKTLAALRLYIWYHLIKKHFMKTMPKQDRIFPHSSCMKVNGQQKKRQGLNRPSLHPKILLLKLPEKCKSKCAALSGKLQLKDIAFPKLQEIPAFFRIFPKFHWFDVGTWRWQIHAANNKMLPSIIPKSISRDACTVINDCEMLLSTHIASPFPKKEPAELPYRKKHMCFFWPFKGTIFVQLPFAR